jgi:signal transduction histidine kinase
MNSHAPGNSNKKHIFHLRGISLSHALPALLLVIIGCFSTVIGVLVYRSVDKIVADSQERYSGEMQGAVENEIASFLHVRYSILRDYAGLPVLIQGIMQPEAARANLVDLMSSLSLMEQSCQLIVVDFIGESIHRTQTKPAFDYSDEDWIARMMAEEIDRYFGTSRVGTKHYWRIATPVTYNGRVEGVLIAEIPIASIDRTGSISRLMRISQVEFFDQEMKKIHTIGQPIDTTPADRILTEPPLTIRLRIDQTHEERQVRQMIVRAMLQIIGLSALVIGIVIAITRRLLVIPLQRLRARTSSFGAFFNLLETPHDDRQIKEIAQLSMDFEEMAGHLKDRDLQLRKANETLESRVRDRTQLLENEVRRRELILRGIGDGVVVTDLDHNVIQINPVARKMLGFSDEASSAGNISNLLTRSGVALDSVTDILRSAEQTNEQIVCLDHPVTKVLRIISGTFVDEAGADAGRVLVMHDVTKEMEIDRMKTDFVSSVSHELRTPLTSIKGFAATIIRDPEMPVETRSNFLGIIDEEADRLANLIDDLLEISMIESGKLTINWAMTSPTVIVERAVSSMANEAESAGRIFHSSIEDQLPFISCDPEKTEMCLINLIGNALKYTLHGDRIDVRVGREGSWVVFSVADTGIGVAKNDLSHLFDRFFRSRQPGQEIPGTGLGLAIVKEIIELQDGTVTAMSELGAGSTFEFRLPVRDYRIGASDSEFESQDLDQP